MFWLDVDVQSRLRGAITPDAQDRFPRCRRSSFRSATWLTMLPIAAAAVARSAGRTRPLAGVIGAGESPVCDGGAVVTVGRKPRPARPRKGSHRGGRRFGNEQEVFDFAFTPSATPPRRTGRRPYLKQPANRYGSAANRPDRTLGHHRQACTERPRGAAVGRMVTECRPTTRGLGQYVESAGLTPRRRSGTGRQRHPPRQARACRPSRRTVSFPPHSSARSDKLRSPLRATPGPIPTPSSRTSTSSSSPTSTVSVTTPAPPWRIALLTASRTTATACAPTSAGTTVSTGPAMRTDGVTPEPAAASAAVSRSWRRRPPRSSSLTVCRSKIAVRISRTVVSKSWTACSIRLCTAGSPDRRKVLCRDSPVANSRWITWSCRSRAMRSRSANTSSCRCARFFFPNSNASVACSANDVSSGTSVDWNGCSPAPRSATSTPVMDSCDCRGTATTGPNRARDALSTSSSEADSLRTATRPSTTSRSSGWSAAIRSPSAVSSMPRRAATVKLPSCAGPSTISVVSDRVSSRVRCATRRSASSSPAPASSSARISPVASSHRCRSRVCSNRSAFCTATPAAAASASTTTSSAGVNSRSIDLLRQVQVAEDRIPHAHRHTQERAHRRMVRRKPDRRLVASKIGEAQRRRRIDQLAEQALAFGKPPHPGPRLGVDAHVDEPAQAAVGTEHAQRPVPRLDEVDGRLHDAPQGGVELQFTADGEKRAKQALHPVPHGGDLHQPVLDLAQQLVKPQTREQVRHRRPWHAIAHRDRDLAPATACDTALSCPESVYCLRVFGPNPAEARAGH